MSTNSSHKEIVLGTVFGTALSIVLSVVLLLTTSVSAQISLLIALVGIILSALLGACVVFARRLDELSGTLLEGTKLKALVDMPDMEREVVDLVTHLQNVVARAGGQKGFFWEASLLAVEDAKSAVSSMASGVVNCTVDQEIEYVERALRLTTKTVMAVAARGSDWWTKPEADVYWTVYGKAAQRVRIQRIFLVQGALDDNVKRMLNRHAALGMDTFWTPIEHVPVRLRSPIVLFDGKLLHRTSSSSQHLGNVHVDFTDSPRQLEEARAQFNAILSLPTTQNWPRGTGAT